MFVLNPSTYHRTFFLLCAALLLYLSSTTVVAEDSVRITTQRIDELLFYPERHAPAELMSLNRSMIPAQVSTTVTALAVRVGDQVKRGDRLARLDCQNYELVQTVRSSELEIAKNNVVLAEKAWQRAKTLKRSNNLGAAELDQRATELANAKVSVSVALANQEQAVLDVSRCEIVAPYDAVVLERLVSVGEFVAVGAPLVALTALTQTEVSATVAVSDLPSFSAASAYWLEAAGQRASLELRHLVPVIQNRSRSQEARFILQQAASDLPIGVNGRVVWRSPLAHLPANLITKRGAALGLFVFNAQAGQAEFVAIDGASEGRPLVLTAAQQALLKQRPLIIDGRHGLVDQQPVRLKSEGDVVGDHDQAS